MTRLLPGGRGGTALLLAPVLAAAAATAATAGTGGGVTVDTDWHVLTPADGALVDDAFLLAWTPADDAASYAVVVDGRLPRPGSVVEPGPTTVLLGDREVRLTLGPREGGSPSARHSHAVSVLPLDDDGRRLGEQVALVHVRTQP